jgi:hypothetical protein
MDTLAASHGIGFVVSSLEKHPAFDRCSAASKAGRFAISTLLKPSRATRSRLPATGLATGVPAKWTRRIRASFTPSRAAAFAISIAHRATLGDWQTGRKPNSPKNDIRGAQTHIHKSGGRQPAVGVENMFAQTRARLFGALPTVCGSPLHLR